LNGLLFINGLNMTKLSNGPPLEDDSWFTFHVPTTQVLHVPNGTNAVTTTHVPVPTTQVPPIHGTNGTNAVNHVKSIIFPTGDKRFITETNYVVPQTANGAHAYTFDEHLLFSPGKNNLSGTAMDFNFSTAVLSTCLYL
jgi:hypothetical protein